MAYLLNAIYLFALLATLPYWVFKALTTGKYREGLWSKLSGAAPTPQPGRPVVWIHAVSVGEVLLLRPLLQRLQATRPDLQIVLSTTTNTGFAIAREKYPQLATFYAPLDFTWALNRVFDRLQPTLLVLAELELWPNLLAEARRRSIPVAVVNARMSERSFRRYHKVRGLLRPALSAIKWWGAQTQVYGDRIAELIPPGSATVAVTGSMKYEGAPTERDNPRTEQFRRLFGFDPDELVFIAGSTTSEQEEQTALAAFTELAKEYPSLRLILVPRHKERFDAVADWLQSQQVEFVRRSALSAPRECSAPVTLVDSIGELAAVWGLADFAFVGGSLGGKRGGQSMIEPAGYGVPICFGPNVWNFRDTVDKLLEADGAVQLTGPADMLPTLRSWLQDRAAAHQLGQNARAFIRAQQGAVQATTEAIDRLAPSSVSQRKTA